MKIITIIAALSVPLTAAIGKPVSMPCEGTMTYYTSDGWETVARHFVIAVDDEKGTAGITMVESGWSERDSPAVFLPDRVQWAVPWVTSDRMATLDRVTLRFRSVSSVSPADVWEAQCQIAKAVEGAQF